MGSEPKKVKNVRRVVMTESVPEQGEPELDARALASVLSPNLRRSLEGVEYVACSRSLVSAA